MPTINDLLEKNAKVILAAHFGRPKGESNQKMSLIQISEALETAIGVKIIFSNDCIGSDVVNASQNLKEGNVLLCENLRFYPQEEDNDKEEKIRRRRARSRILKTSYVAVVIVKFVCS